MPLRLGCAFQSFAKPGYLPGFGLSDASFRRSATRIASVTACAASPTMAKMSHLSGLST